MCAASYLPRSLTSLCVGRGVFAAPEVEIDRIIRLLSALFYADDGYTDAELLQRSVVILTLTILLLIYLIGLAPQD